MDTIHRLPFDAIALLSADGPRPISIAEVVGLTVPERVRLLAAGRLVFTWKGERVDAATAIRALYAQRRASATTLKIVTAVDDEL